jgi:hypothetical protein
MSLTAHALLVGLQKDSNQSLSNYDLPNISVLYKSAGPTTYVQIFVKTFHKQMSGHILKMTNV